MFFLGPISYDKYCRGQSGGIADMYPANDWYFIHCDAGAWCKPCPTKGLVYNKNCGQCEATRDGLCTGPSKILFDLLFLYSKFQRVSNHKNFKLG